ncbi:MAG: ABC transporter permease [Spirochaetes bacterium]|nr:ABC transporter permease [Spirochaetota bacterium]
MLKNQMMSKDLLLKNKLFLFIGRSWTILFLLFEVIFFSIFVRGFLSLEGVQIVFFFTTAIFLIGVGELFVIITGGIDLSVGFVMGFSSIISAKLIVTLVNNGFTPSLAILIGVLITLCIGLIPGLINGLLIAQLKVPPFIATFSMLSITYGISELLIQGIPAKNLPQLANSIGNGYFFYIIPERGIFSFFLKPQIQQRGELLIEILPNTVIITFVIIAILAFVLKWTKFGQHTYAIGGNEDAAIRAGINVKKHIVKIYMLSSFLASVAGVLYMLKYVTGKADAGSSFLLDSIVAVVIGGASLYGGIGTVGKTVIGCTILAVLETGLRMYGIPTFDKYIAVGLILVFAVLVDQFFPELIHKELT